MKDESSGAAELISVGVHGLGQIQNAEDESRGCLIYWSIGEYRGYYRAEEYIEGRREEGCIHIYMYI